MPTEMLLIGYPGCGKTTIAKEFIRKFEKTVIICRDDIRTMLCGGYSEYKHSEVKEGLVRSMAVSMIECAFERGYGVIIDEVNMTKKRRTYWMNMSMSIAERKGVDVNFIGVWLDTPIDVCKERRMADPKGTNDGWSAIIDNMIPLSQNPTEDEFDSFQHLKYGEDYE